MKIMPCLENGKINIWRKYQHIKYLLRTVNYFIISKQKKKKNVFILGFFLLLFVSFYIVIP